MTVTILEEYRMRDRITTLERMPSGELVGKYRVKDVQLTYYRSEKEARSAYQEIVQPPPKMAKKRGRPKKSAP